MSEHEKSTLPSLTVGELLADDDAASLGLVLLSGGDGIANVVDRSRIQKPGLALAGFLEYIHPGRIQVLGKSETSFLNERAPAERSRIVSQLCRQGVSCFVLTTGLEPPDELLDETERQGVPLHQVVISLVDLASRIGMELGQEDIPLRGVLGGMSDEVVMIGEHSLPLQMPTVLLGELEQRVMQQVEFLLATKDRQLVQRPGSDDVGAVIAQAMHRRVRPIRFDHRWASGGGFVGRDGSGRSGG